MAKTIHIVVVSIPAFSHLTSIISFCKKLLDLHPHFHFTCIIPTIDSSSAETLTSLKSLPSSSIDYTLLPSINKQDLPQDVSPVVQMQLAISQSMPSFRNTLSSLSRSKQLVALIADPCANEAVEIAKEAFNLASFIYFPLSAMAVSVLLHSQILHEQVTCEYKDHNEVIRIPGCIPFHGHDLPDSFQDRSSLQYEFFLKCCKKFSLADGILVNSFFKMEEATMKALEESFYKRDAHVYMVGPIIRSRETIDSSECVRWLETQRGKSVLYVSFGSVGTLSKEQVNELAFGLEMSRQEFLWVLRAPSDSTNVDETYLSGEGGDAHENDINDPLKFLPHEFLVRTKEQGLVVTSWVPQIQILSHNSIGGFLTHCGWNSALESIVYGVPMLVWPLFAEQKINALLFSDGLKVAMRPEYNENGLVERGEIAKVIKSIMLDGEEIWIRENIKELKNVAADAFKEDGSSMRALSQFGNLLESFIMQQ